MSASRPTILQVIPNLDTGGAELAVVEISEAITRAGGRALVVAEHGRLSPDVVKAGGEIITMRAATKNPVRMAANALEIARIIRREQVDLVHARSRAPAWSAWIAARQTSRPFVTTFHGAYSERSRVKSMYNSIMARGDIVIANSRFTADLIRQRYATPQERIRIIYRGLDAAKFSRRPEVLERANAMRLAWGVAPEQKIILQAARLTSWKGQAVLIDAAARLAQSGQLGNTVVILAGDHQGRDGYVEGLRSQITAAGLAAQVRLVGHVEDIPAAYACAYVTVVASTGPEAFGRAGAEAQAMGSPVISTDIGAPPETVKSEPYVLRSERTGWLVPPGDSVVLSRVLAEAIGLEPTEREKLGARASMHALSSFTLAGMKRQTLEVYDQLLSTQLAHEFTRHST